MHVMCFLARPTQDACHLQEEVQFSLKFDLVSHTLSCKGPEECHIGFAAMPGVPVVGLAVG